MAQSSRSEESSRSRRSPPHQVPPPKRTNFALWFGLISLGLLGAVSVVGYYGFRLKMHQDELQQELALWEVEERSGKVDGYGFEEVAWDYDGSDVEGPGLYLVTGFKGEPTPSPSLSTNYTPISYGLQVVVNLPGYQATIQKKLVNTVQGTLNIEIDVLKESEFIELHASGITIENAHIVQGLNRRRSLNWVANTKYEKIAFGDGSPIEVGLLKMNIDYSMPLSTGMTGFYRYMYKKEGTQEERVGAMSYLKHNYARRLVPCFDEPTRKATWSISVRHPGGTRAISNELEAEQQKYDNWLNTRFLPTPKMSTYLLSLTVADLDYDARVTRDGRMIRLFSHKSLDKYSTFTIDTIVALFDKFVKFLNTPQPLKKLDFLVAPYFPHYTMESWGVVTVPETLLLPHNTSSVEMRRVVRVLANQIAQQWFGNMIAMDLWDEEWVKESFSKWMEIVGLKLIDQGFNVDTDYLLLQETALNEDRIWPPYQMNNRHGKPIYSDEKPYRPPAEKGAAFISTLYNVFPRDDQFVQGLTKFFASEDRFGSTNVKNLWKNLNIWVPGAVRTRYDFPEMASEWMWQPGFPVLKVKQNSKATDIISKFAVTIHKVDKPWMNAPADSYPFEAPDKTPRDIPFHYHSADVSGMTHFDPDTSSISIMDTDNSPPIVNYESRSMARTIYAVSDYWYQLLVGKDAQELPPLTRARLISDLFFAADSGYHPTYNFAFDIAKGMLANPVHAPEIKVLRNILEEIRSRMRRDTNKANVEIVNTGLAYLLKYRHGIDMETTANLDQEFAQFGDQKRGDELQIALDFIELQCLVSNLDCVDHLENWFDTRVINECGDEGIVSQCSEIAPIFRPITYCNAVRSGRADVFNYIYKALLREVDPTERIYLVKALGCDSSTTNLLKIIKKGIDKDNTEISAVEVKEMLESMDGHGPDLFDIFQTNWQMMHQNLRDFPQLYADIVSGLLKVMTAPKITKLKTLLSARPELRPIAPFEELIHRNEQLNNWVNLGGSKFSSLPPSGIFLHPYNTFHLQSSFTIQYVPFR